jgi:cation:H+ antiporter
MNDYVALALGVLSAGVGGELFVRGSVGLARWARVSAGIVGATVAAFGTSSPELSVGVNSALAGSPGISLGDALGSNVVNLGLILGATLVIGSIRCPIESVKRDFPAALLAPIAMAALACDGELSRLDGLILLGAFCCWLAVVLREAWRQRSASEETVVVKRWWAAVLCSVGGLALLVGAGRLIVTGAGGIAQAMGIAPFLVGAVVVSVGTSVPELATALIAKVRGYDEIGLGTVLGSNIFNAFLIVAAVAIIHPIEVVWDDVSVALLFGLATTAVTWPSRQGVLGRARGFALLVLYVAYIVAIMV